MATIGLLALPLIAQEQKTAQEQKKDVPKKAPAAAPKPTPAPSPTPSGPPRENGRSEEHTSELQSHLNLVCRLLLEKKKNYKSEILSRNDAPSEVHDVRNSQVIGVKPETWTTSSILPIEHEAVIKMVKGLTNYAIVR